MVSGINPSPARAAQVRGLLPSVTFWKRKAEKKVFAKHQLENWIIARFKIGAIDVGARMVERRGDRLPKMNRKRTWHQLNVAKLGLICINQF